LHNQIYMCIASLEFQKTVLLEQKLGT